MQVRASGGYKKPHQSGDVRASCAPSAHRRLRRRLRPRHRCAARHCGWDMIRWHIRLSALVSSSHQAPFAVCVCVSHSDLKREMEVESGRQDPRQHEDFSPDTRAFPACIISLQTLNSNKCST